MNSELALIEPELVESVSVAQQIAQAEIDIQVATAKRFPRNLDTFTRRAKAMAIRNPEVAASCFYVLPRGGKKLTGGNIRLAEIVATGWGNLRLEARILAAEEKFIRARGTAWDLETNVAFSKDGLRRITDSRGNRYSDDMIVTTGNAAASIAIRNAIFSVVPRVYVQDIVEHCMQVAAGKRGNLEDERKKWIAWYEEQGITRGQLLEMLGKDGVEAIDIDDITTLQGLHNAVKEGETTLVDVFGAAPAEDGSRKFGFAKKPNGTTGTNGAKS